MQVITCDSCQSCDASEILVFIFWWCGWRHIIINFWYYGVGDIKVVRHEQRMWRGNWCVNVQSHELYTHMIKPTHFGKTLTRLAFISALSELAYWGNLVTSSALIPSLILVGWVNCKAKLSKQYFDKFWSINKVTWFIVLSTHYTVGLYCIVWSVYRW